MMHYRCVLFDLDGTLLDTGEGIAASFTHAANRLGLPPLSPDELSACIGPPLSDSWARLYGLTDDRLDEAVRVFREYYNTVGIFKASVYPGVAEVLETLGGQGRTLGVATYKREDSAEKILEHFGLRKQFSCVFGSDPGGERSKTDIVELCLRSAGVAERNRAVLVGDSSSDAEAARKAGIAFVGVTYGYGFKCGNAVQTFPHVAIAGSFEELPGVLP